MKAALAVLREAEVVDLPRFASTCCEARQLGLEREAGSAEAVLAGRREAAAGKLADAGERGEATEVERLCRIRRSLGGKAAAAADAAESRLLERKNAALATLEGHLRSGEVRNIERYIQTAEWVGVSESIVRAARAQHQSACREVLKRMERCSSVGTLSDMRQALADADLLGLDTETHGALGRMRSRYADCRRKAVSEAGKLLTLDCGSFDHLRAEIKKLEMGSLWDALGLVTRLHEGLQRRTLHPAGVASFPPCLAGGDGGAKGTVEDPTYRRVFPWALDHGWGGAGPDGPADVEPGCNVVAFLARFLGPASVLRREAIRAHWAAAPTVVPKHGAEGGHEATYASRLVRSSKKIGQVLDEALLRQNCSTHSLDAVTKLCLSLEGLSDMKEIRKCRRLTHLDLSVNMIGKIDGLEACRDLQELSMKENKLLSTDGLQHASALQRLALDANLISDLDGLSDLVNLKVLTLNENRLHSLSTSLKFCTNLQQLELSGNFLKATASLHKNQALKKLSIARNMLESLDDIAACPALQNLVANDNKVKVMPKLWASPYIQTLNLSGNQLTEIPAMLHMPNLRFLCVQDNAISRIGGLEGMPNLEVADFSFNSIASVATLLSLSPCHMLAELQLNDNPIASEAGYADAVGFILPQLKELDNEPCDTARRIEASYAQNLPLCLPHLRLLRGRSACGEFAPFGRGAAARDPAAPPSSLPARPSALSVHALRPAFLAQERLAETWDANTHRYLFAVGRLKNGRGSKPLKHADPAAFQDRFEADPAFWDRSERATERQVVKLQAAWRAFRARRALARLRSAEYGRALELAAVKVQALARGKLVRTGPELRARRAEHRRRQEARRQKARALEEQRRRVQLQKQEAERSRALARAAAAAVRIQARWRGTRVRLKLQKIRAEAKYEDDDEFDYGGVDESEWLPPDDLLLDLDAELGETADSIQFTLADDDEPAPRPSPRSVHLPPIALGPATSASASASPRSPAMGSGGSPPRPVPRLPLEALVRQDSTASLASSSGTGGSAPRSDRKAQKIASLASEWGFKDQATAELFWKKQRKLKGAKKKKLPDSQTRFQRFAVTAGDRVQVEKRVKKRGAALAIHRGEVQAPPSRNTARAARARPGDGAAPSSSSRAPAAEPAAPLRATASSNAKQTDKADSFSLGRSSSFLPGGKTLVGNWTGGDLPPASSPRRPRGQRRFR